MVLRMVVLQLVPVVLHQQRRLVRVVRRLAVGTCHRVVGIGWYA